MPQYIALKTMLGEYGPMHRGMTYTLPKDYGLQLMRNQLVRPLPERSAPKNAAHAGAPLTKDAPAGEDTAAQLADGLGKPSSASRPDRPSRRRTAGTSNTGPG